MPNKRKSSQVDNCEYIDSRALRNEPPSPTTPPGTRRGGPLVGGAPEGDIPVRKAKGPPTICDVNPFSPPPHKGPLKGLGEGLWGVVGHDVDKVEEWLLKTSNYIPPSDRTF